MLSWQNILNKRDIAADIEEKLTNQGEVLRGGISRIYLSLSNKWKPCNGAIKIWPHNLRTALEKYFQFHWNCKQLRIEATNSVANWDIYFPIFSETVHTGLKIFSQRDLRKLGKGYCKKIGCYNFWLDLFSIFKFSINEFSTQKSCILLMLSLFNKV